VDATNLDQATYEAGTVSQRTNQGSAFGTHALQVCKGGIPILRKKSLTFKA